MKTVDRIAKMRELSRQMRGAGLRVALVPTMGALHEGHLELVRRARALADVVVVSIFVNPTQFNDPGDLANYPRQERRDAALLAAERIEVLFAPIAEEVYPRGSATRIHVADLGAHLCGPGRPGHFDAVATVVAALFHMVEPDLAVFGEKDYQQLQIIRRMVRDLHLPVEIVAAPTVREADGLAMSSRNARLSSADRAIAPVIQRALREAAQAFAAGETCSAELIARARAFIERHPGIAIEYLEVVDGDSLAPVATASAEAVIAAAADIGGVRLIDNIVLARFLAEQRAAQRLQELEADDPSPIGAEPHA